MGSLENQAKFLNKIGNILLLTGQAEKAEEWYLKRFAARELSDATGKVVALLGLGIVYRSLGKFAEALANFEKTRQIGVFRPKPRKVSIRNDFNF